MLICVLWGYEGHLKLMGDGLQPTSVCEHIQGTTYGFIALKAMMPYIVDLLILSIFAFKIPKNITKIIPYTAAADIFIYNFLPHLTGGGENDYTLLENRIPQAYLLLLLITLTALIVFSLKYRKEAMKSLYGLEAYWKRYTGISPYR